MLIVSLISEVDASRST
jgi:hypothetical protein